MCLVLIPQDLVAYIVCGFLEDILIFFHLVLSNICCSGGYSLIFDPHNKKHLLQTIFNFQFAQYFLEVHKGIFQPNFLFSSPDPKGRVRLLSSLGVGRP